MAVIIKCLTPAFLGVPEMVAVPLCALANVRSCGTFPAFFNAGMGAPEVVMVNENGAPTMTETLPALVIALTLSTVNGSQAPNEGA